MSGPQPPPAIRSAPEARPTALDLPRVQTQTPVAQAAVRSEDSRPISEARESFEPLLTEVPQGMGPTLKSEGPKLFSITSLTPLIPEVSQGAGPNLRTVREDGLREKPVGSVEPGPEQPGQELTPRAPHRPLMVETIRQTDVKIFRDSPPLSSLALRIGKSDQRHRAARPEREADEIQIHIGRIEVAAVTPAPARPPAQPVRKSLRLDEYLRRGR
jgi:hypothetical protein